MSTALAPPSSSAFTATVATSMRAFSASSTAAMQTPAETASAGERPGASLEATTVVARGRLLSFGSSGERRSPSVTGGEATYAAAESPFTMIGASYLSPALHREERSMRPVVSTAMRVVEFAAIPEPIDPRSVPRSPVPPVIPLEQVARRRVLSFEADDVEISEASSLRRLPLAFAGAWPMPVPRGEAAPAPSSVRRVPLALSSTASSGSVRRRSPDNVTYPVRRRLQFAIGGAGGSVDSSPAASSAGGMFSVDVAVPARMRPAPGLVAGATPSPLNLLVRTSAVLSSPAKPVRETTWLRGAGRSLHEASSSAAASSPARSAKDITWLYEVCHSLHNASSFTYRGAHYALRCIGTGQHSGVYAISDELVVKAFLIPASGKRSRGPSVSMLARIKGQAEEFARDGLSVARIINDPIEDGYIIQERIHGSMLTPLCSLTSVTDLLTADTIKQFIDYAVNKNVVVDLQLSNFIVNADKKPVLVDYYEEALDDDEEVLIEQKKFIKDFLKAFCGSAAVGEYLTQDIPEEFLM